MRIPSREVCRVQVIGCIWWPMGLLCAQDRTLSGYDLENIGEWTRDNVEQWVCTHFGDFSKLVDFRADFSRDDVDWISEWAQGEESEIAYMDAMYPCEADVAF